MRSIKLVEGDILAVEFVKNQKEGKKPICLIDGVVGFVNKTYKGSFIQEHSIWHVEISQVNERTVVVDPIQIVKSAAQNQNEINERMKLLRTERPDKPKKQKTNWKYKSQQERDSR